MARVATPCDHCGQNDDHPKLHYGEETYHHDCTPAKVRAAVADVPVVLEIIAAAESGIRGDDLVAKIAELHAEPIPADVPTPAAVEGADDTTAPATSTEA